MPGLCSILPRRQPITDAVRRATQRNLVDQLVGDSRGGFVLFAVQIVILNGFRLAFETKFDGDVVVVILRPRAINAR